MNYQDREERPRRSSDELLDRKFPSAYAPNQRQWVLIKLPPGVNPESLVCYASTDGQD